MLKHREGSKVHGSLAAIGIAILAIAVGALVIHFSWNMAVPELFGASEMSFKNAFGIVILLGAAAAIFHFGLVGRHSRSIKRKPANNDS